MKDEDLLLHSCGTFDPKECISAKELAEELVRVKKFNTWDEVKQHLADGKAVHCPTNTYWADRWHCYEECCCEGDDYTLEEMMEWVMERADLEDLEAYD